GTDLVAESRLDFGGVYLVRGSERGGYAKWLRAAGGAYDGFLLSTANVFANELGAVLEFIDQGKIDAAHALSAKVEAVVSAAFAIVADFPVGNAFTNANKALFHCLENGRSAMHVPPPMLYS